MPTLVARGQITITDVNDGYTVYLTKESHTYPASNSGVISDYTTGYSEVRVVKGGTLLTCPDTGTTSPTVDNTYKVTSISVSSGTMTYTTDINSNQYRIKPSALTTDIATLTITIAVKGTGDSVVSTFTKVLTYSKSIKGDTGATGSTGAASYNHVKYVNSIFRENWWSNSKYTKGNTSVVSNSDGILRLTSTTADPYINMPSLGSFDPTIARYILIKYKVISGTASSMQIYFFNSLYSSTNEAQKVEANLISDGAWHTLGIDMWTHANWKTQGNITGWRYDWCSGNAVTMDLDLIHLCSDMTSTTGQWMGTYVDTTAVDSTNFSSYSWAKIATDYDWIEEWDATAAYVGTDKVLTPKIFAGTTTPSITGVSIGKFDDTTKLGASSFVGIKGINAGATTFSLDATTGNGTIGGWSFDGTKLSSSNISLDSTNKLIKISDGTDKVLLGQYETGKYGLKVLAGSIETDVLISGARSATFVIADGSTTPSKSQARADYIVPIGSPNAEDIINTAINALPTVTIITGTTVAATANTITLATSASNVLDEYLSYTIEITAGTGIGQSRLIIGHSNTRVSTIDNDWTTIPDTTSVYKITTHIGKIILLEGTYTISGSIYVVSNTSIEGQGPGTVIRLASGINVAVDMITNASPEYGNQNIVLDKFQIDGNKNGNTAGTQNAIYLRKVFNTKVINAIVYSMRNGGIEINNATPTNLDSTPDDGNNIVSGNFLYDNGSGIKVFGSDNNTVTSNTIEYCGFGIAIYHSTNNNTSNNTIISSSGQGIYLEDAKYNTLLGNTYNGLDAKVGNGIKLVNSTSNTIQANNLINCAMGVVVEGSSSNTVNNNKINDTTSHGIYVIDNASTVASKDNSITGNKVYKATGSNIYLTGHSENNLVSGNILRAKELGDVAATSSYGITATSTTLNNHIINNDIFDTFLTDNILNSGTNIVAGNKISAATTIGSWSSSDNSALSYSGNVGIGTSPTSALQVSGLTILSNPNGDNYNENLRLPASNSDYASIALGATAGTSGTGVGQWSIVRYPAVHNYKFCVGYNTAEYLDITSTGAVGIGATIPIQVRGLELRYSNTAGQGYGFLTSLNNMYVSSNAYYDGAWKYIGAYKASNISYGSDGNIVFRNTNTTGAAGGAITWTNSMTIASTGLVGIGKTPTTYALEVNGDIQATNFRGALIGTSTNATNLIATDNRAIKPASTNKSRVSAYFVSLSGMTGSDSGAPYQDLLVLNSYSDDSGGYVNALTFDKSDKIIRYWQAGQTANTWGTPKILAYADGTAGYATYWSDSNTLTKEQYLSVSRGGTGAGTFTANALLKGNGTNAVSSSVIYDTGTSVGIGIASPNSRLDILGNTTDTYLTIRMQDSNTDTDNEWSRIRFALSDNTFLGHIGYGRQNSSYQGLIIRSKDIIGFDINGLSTPAAIINTSGYIGIGTASPSGRLHVVDSAFENTALFERSALTTDVCYGALRLLATKTTDMADGFGVNVNFNIKDDAGVNNLLGSVGAARAGADNTGDLIFLSANAGSNSEKMRITSAGRVGIGTIAPGGATDAKFTIRADTATHNSNTIAYLAAFNRVNSDIAAWYFGADTSANAIMASNNSNMLFGRDLNGTFTEYMRILNANGNVGISTATPNFTLDVNGNIRIRGSNKLYFGGIGATDNDVNLYHGGANTLATDDDFIIANGRSFYLSSGESYAKLEIYANGTLSWGTGTAPRDVNLYRVGADILGTDDQFRSTRGTATDTAYTTMISGEIYARYVMYADGKQEWGPGSATRDTSLYRYAADVLKTDDTFIASKIGIGTDSPERTLDVFGNISSGVIMGIKNTSASGYCGVHFLSSDGTSMGHIGYANTSAPHYTDCFYVGTVASKKLKFSTADTTRMSIAATGEVGIGTETPGEELEVIGTAKATSFKTASWEILQDATTGSMKFVFG